MLYSMQLTANPRSTKFATVCARCGCARGQHYDSTQTLKLQCPGPWLVPQTFKRPSDKRKG